MPLKCSDRRGTSTHVRQLDLVPNEAFEDVRHHGVDDVISIALAAEIRIIRNAVAHEAQYSTGNSPQALGPRHERRVSDELRPIPPESYLQGSVSGEGIPPGAVPAGRGMRRRERRSGNQLVDCVAMKIPRPHVADDLRA